MSGTVTCFDEQGQPVAIAREALQFSPAAYGILLESDRVLLQRHGGTGLWLPPGGRIESGQTPEQTLRAYFLSTTMLIPSVGPLLAVEKRYRADDIGQGWRLVLLYYEVQRPPTGVISLGAGSSEEWVEWVALQELTREQMLFGFRAVQVAQQRRRTSS